MWILQICRLLFFSTVLVGRGVRRGRCVAARWLGLRLCIFLFLFANVTFANVTEHRNEDFLNGFVNFIAFLDQNFFIAKLFRNFSI